MKHINESLRMLGFREKESLLILTLLVLGRTTISKLARTVKLPRTTILPIMEKIERRGIVTRVTVGNHKEWKIADLNEFRAKLEKAVKIFESR